MNSIEKLSRNSVSSQKGHQLIQSQFLIILLLCSLNLVLSICILHLQRLNDRLTQNNIWLEAQSSRPQSVTLKLNSGADTQDTNESEYELGFRAAEAISFLPQVDNLDRFDIDDHGYSPNYDYYILGLGAGSPIPHREEMQGIWIITTSSKIATRLTRDEHNQLFSSSFVDWIDEYRVAFIDQLSPTWGTGQERDYIIYDVRTQEFTPARYKDVLPPVKEIKTFGFNDYGVSFLAPVREYPKYSQMAKLGYQHLCQELDLRKVTDPTVYLESPNVEAYLSGTLFDVIINKDGSYQIGSHDQDSMLRDACVTEDEYQKVIETIKVNQTKVSD